MRTRGEVGLIGEGQVAEVSVLGDEGCEGLRGMRERVVSYMPRWGSWGLREGDGRGEAGYLRCWLFWE